MITLHIITHISITHVTIHPNILPTTYLPNSHAEQGTSFERVEGLRLDYEGQVLQALSRQDWWLKWGKHYLQSLQRCHRIKDAIRQRSQ